MSRIKPGMLCYLNEHTEYVEYRGRVVTAVARYYGSVLQRSGRMVDASTDAEPIWAIEAALDRIPPGRGGRLVRQ